MCIRDRGELITERGIGNGMSLLIFAGIAARIPIEGKSILDSRGSVVFTMVCLAALAIVVGVVFVEQGQRRIPVQYAKRMVGRRTYGGTNTYIPIKVNMAGVIPAIFASSILLFPASIAQWFGQSASGMEWLQNLAFMIGPGQPLNIVLFTALIVFFCFFYTALVFNPKEVADNLKKSGAYVPGIRPGEQTASFIDGVLSRLTMFGAAYIAAVCLLPQFLVVVWNVPFYLGVTSLLIVVVVVMDFMAQVQSHLMSHQYDSLLKKSNLQSFGRR